MSKKLPPLNPLKVFDAVVRTQNLTKAAQELHISQSAVSKQLNVLQTYLGIELFRRERHGISLTQAGVLYGEEIAPACEAIRGRLGRVKGLEERIAREIGKEPALVAERALGRDCHAGRGMAARREVA